MTKLRTGTTLLCKILFFIHHYRTFCILTRRQRSKNISARTGWYFLTLCSSFWYSASFFLSWSSKGKFSLSIRLHGKTTHGIKFLICSRCLERVALRSMKELWRTFNAFTVRVQLRRQTVKILFLRILSNGSHILKNNLLITLYNMKSQYHYLNTKSTPLHWGIFSS